MMGTEVLGLALTQTPDKSRKGTPTYFTLLLMQTIWDGILRAVEMSAAASSMQWDVEVYLWA